MPDSEAVSQPSPRPRIPLTELQDYNNRLDELSNHAAEEQEQPMEFTQAYEGIMLSSADPFECALIELVELNRRKRADYAVDGDPFSNFHRVADRMKNRFPEFTAHDAVLFNILQKEERLTALRVNGREPSNESVTDSYKDKAVYAIIDYALSLQEEEGQHADNI